MAASVQNSFAADQVYQELEHRLTQTVLPLLKAHCFDCHGATKQEGMLKLSDDSHLQAIAKNYRTWEIVLQRLKSEEMPPKDASKQPSRIERQAIIEFDYSIRDLTGVDIRPTREFPVDPANEEGFDNSGESLTMSPALVKKYLTAARLVADHLVLTPNGLTFAPHAAVTETDRDKFCVQQIVSFYQRHEVDYSDYFFAAWQFHHRKNLGKPEATLTDIAANFVKTKKRVPVRESQQPADREPKLASGTSTLRSPLSPKYLTTVWAALTDSEATGPLAELQDEWRKLPVATDCKIL